MALRDSVVESKLKWGKYSLAYRKRLAEGGRALGSFLESNGLDWTYIEKNKSHKIDALLDSFVKHLHSMELKSGLRIAKHAVLFVQASRPRLKKTLKTTWNSLRSWEEQQPSGFRPPVPVAVLAALVCKSRQLGLKSENSQEKRLWHSVGTLLLVGFFGLLRPGEMFGLCCSDVTLPNSVSMGSPFAVLMIRSPKNSRQMGKQQFAEVHNPDAVNWLAWSISVAKSKSARLWPSTPQKFRLFFKKLCSHLQLSNLKISPASLRAGGATWMLDQGFEVSLIRFKGRWTNLRSLEHYIQVARAQQITLTIADKVAESLKCFLRRYCFMLTLPSSFAAQTPYEQLLTSPALEIASPSDVIAAIHTWGRAAASISSNHHIRRPIEGRSLP